METSTKNKQALETIQAMASKAFGQVTIAAVEELKEGYFNVAYLLALCDGREVILKIAPPKDAVTMSYEKNIMFSEVDSMLKVYDSLKVPVAQILFYDNSHSLCDSDYFFMSKLSGKSLNVVNSSLTEDAKAGIQYLLGRYNREINTITNEKFGYYGLADKQGDIWYPVFKQMLLDLIEDAKVFHIDFKIDLDELFTFLERDKSVFEEVDTPRLIHWDLWAGNVFVENNSITGLIDFERCLWGDILMECGFRTHQQDENFLKGYGITDFTNNQKIRILWYDIYLFLNMSMECDYRNYETKDMYYWATGMLKKCVEELIKR